MIHRNAGVESRPAGTSGNFALGGFDPEENRHFIMYFFSGGGYGGWWETDGLTNGCSSVGISKTQPVEILDITDADNRVTTVYFNQRTKLPMRQVYYHRDPTTRDKIEEETIFAKYRDVGGGVMWPFNIRRERNGEKIFEIYSDSVEVDQDLTDDLFTLPANMKILTKGKKK